jgi:hypothetical protein
MRKLDRLLEVTQVALVSVAGGGLFALAAVTVGPSLAGGALALVGAGLLATAAEGARPRFYALAPRDRAARRPGRRRRALIAALSTLLLLGLVWYAAPRPLTALPAADLHAAFEEDAELYDAHARGLMAVALRLEQLGAPPAGSAPLGADDERVLLDSWRAVLDYAVALEGLRLFYQDYYRFDLGRRRGDHVMAFLLTFAADAALFESAARLARQIARNPNAVKFLDAPHEGVPAGSFTAFRAEICGTADGVRVSAGKRYLEALQMGGLDDTVGPRAAWLRERLDAHLARIGALGLLERAELGYDAEIGRIGRALGQVFFPVQKKAAEMMGDTRVRRIHRYLIDRALREHVDGMLEPGDVLIARKNWYLSNLGLPGFWPHAMIYLGDRDKLVAYFDDDAVRAWAAAQGAPDLGSLLSRRFPQAWAKWNESHDGEPRRVLEAISEGVSLSTLAECAGDYLAAIRPRLDKVAKAQAIVAAFSNYGRPYDFDFDFATDHALVCTELVWRAYRPAEGKPGVSFEPVRLAGRSTLPANDIAAQYARQYGTPDAQLDFVAFVDAREKENRAFLSTEEAFRASWQRVKWDVAQE